MYNVIAKQTNRIWSGYHIIPSIAAKENPLQKGVQEQSHKHRMLSQASHSRWGYKK
jgi:hypothetical protein